MRFLLIFVGLLVALMLAAAFAPVALVARGLDVFPLVRELPDGELLRKTLVSCQIDRVTGREFVLCPHHLGYREFPKHLADALVASEDRDFYTHKGVDKKSILFAAVANILRSVREMHPVTRRGGSTITQQLARTLFLDERDGLIRKVQEAALAARIEWAMSKQQILTAYMNVVPHARGLNGFDAAARQFFGVGAGQIDLAEAALLVGMLPAPNDRDPLLHPDAAVDAAIRVLQRMVDQGKIGMPERNRAETEITNRILHRQLRRGSEVPLKVEFRPYRDLAVREAAQHDISLDGDYRLITNMDLDFQSWVVTETARAAGQVQAAGVFIDPSGNVLGIAGSRDYVQSPLNRAYKSLQQIGSTGKLFVMVAAYEYGLDMNRKFPDTPLRDGKWPAEPDKLCRGSKTLPEALVHSCNRPFSWAAAALGSRLQRLVGRFGLKPPDSPILVPLGGIEASPLQLARVYASLENGGRLPPVHALIGVLGLHGRALYQYSEPWSLSVMSPDTAKRVLHDLRGPVESGTATAANSKLTVVYGKTGTTQHDADALFVGLTQDFVGAFWVGDDFNKALEGIHGGGAPARAFLGVTDAFYLWKERHARDPDVVGAIHRPPDRAMSVLSSIDPRIFVFVIVATSVGMVLLYLDARFTRRRERKRKATPAPAQGFPHTKYY